MRHVVGAVLVLGAVLAPAVPAWAGGVSATVPVVATTVTDGLPGALPAGTVSVDVPVWLAPGRPVRTARITVSGTTVVRCPAVPLRPGSVVRVRCAFAGKGVTVVRLWAGAAVVRSWSHSAR